MSINFLEHSIPRQVVQSTVERYLDLHVQRDVERRRAEYATMVNAYYDLVTDFYEYGWGEAFHFAPRYRGESFRASLARHQHLLGSALRARRGGEILDAGCGVGGPSRSLARFADVRVLGLNNNAYQVQRARTLTDRAGLSHRCRFVHGDFMAIDLEPERFAGAIAVESTAHAPDKTACFREIFRTLRPGARFVGYEWCLTPKFDPLDREHRSIRAGIERGNGLPDIATIPEVEEALRDAGFEVLHIEDRAHASDPETPWYLPLSGKGIGPRELLMKPLGRAFTHHLVGLLERVGVLPDGTQGVTRMLNDAAYWLVRGGETGLFTPMLFFTARKPR